MLFKKEPHFNLSAVEEELRKFQVQCRRTGLTDDEVAELCSTLIPPSHRRKFFRGLAFFGVVAFLYALSYVEYFAWHYSAVGRIVMREVLPYWDWQRLKGEDCLLRNPLVEGERQEVTCYFCDAIDGVSYMDTLDVDHLKEQYVDLDVPVVLSYSYNISDDFFADMLGDPKFADSLPCILASNVPYGHGDPIEDFLVKLQRYTRHFLHFQTCDYPALKSLRRVFPKPQFLPEDTSPVQYIWMLSSRNYAAGNFKLLNPKDRIASMVQLYGGNVVRLHPMEPCRDSCRSLEVDLKADEVLIFSSYWRMEYRPSGNADNFALIFETH